MLPSLDADVAVALTAERQVTASPGALETQIQTRVPEGARPVTMQILDAVRQNAPGSFEVTLVPEELGRLRLTVTPGEAGLAIVMSADRPETLDLMRRSIDILAQEARDEGFGTLDFAFEGSERGGGHPEWTREPDPPSAVSSQPKPPAALAAPVPQHGAPGGLDIRL